MRLRRVLVAASVAVLAAVLLPGVSFAQGVSIAQTRSLAPTQQQFAPGGGGGGAGAIGPGQTLVQPNPTSQVPGPPLAAPSAAIPVGQVGLMLSARYGRDSQPINANLVWRIYPVRPDQGGAFRPIKEDKSPAPTIALPPGDYVVEVTFGLASAAKAVHLRSEVTREVFEIPAGGLRLEGRVGDVKIPTGQISFDIFPGSQFDPGDKRPIAAGVTTGEVVIVPEGTYHLVSNYGEFNSIVRSDIRVRAGKLTDVTVTHRAAAITLKLVSDQGGEALANTTWSVLTPGGDEIVRSISGAFPKVVLAEGEYRAVARNDGKIYQRTFKVTTGVDGEIEVLAH